jgi:hypothetical protein
LDDGERRADATSGDVAAIGEVMLAAGVLLYCGIVAEVADWFVEDGWREYRRRLGLRAAEDATGVGRL